MIADPAATVPTPGVLSDRCALTPEERRQIRSRDHVARSLRDGLQKQHRHPTERGAAWQAARRSRDHRLRRDVCAAIRWATWCGWTIDRACNVIGIETRTHRAWLGRIGLPPEPLGRAVKPIPVPVYRDIQQHLAIWGPAVGLDDLHADFPAVPRRALNSILWVARNDHFQQFGRLLWARWHIAGAVWAMDFTEADHRIDGEFRWVLVIRDLASGYTLAAVPAECAKADVVVATLTSLCLRHDAPLVLKSDNGSHFINDDVRAYLAQQRIVHLISPPYWPRFNGACEAGIGALKCRIATIARHVGSPGHWTADMVEGARLWANGNAVQRRRRIPDQEWERRVRFTDTNRDHLRQCIDRATATRQAAANQLPVEERPCAATITRTGITDALLHTGYLLIRSRSIPQPLQSRKAV